MPSDCCWEVLEPYLKLLSHQLDENIGGLTDKEGKKVYSNVHINIITPFNLNVIFMHIKICHGHLITSNNGQIFFMQLGAFLQNVQWKTLFMI